MLAAFRGKFLSLRCEFFAFRGKLLDLEPVHQERDLEAVALEPVHDALASDAAAVLSLGNRRQIFPNHRFSRRNLVRAVALPRFAGAKFSGHTSHGMMNVTQMLALSGHSITFALGIKFSSNLILNLAAPGVEHGLGVAVGRLTAI